ncbi:DUF2905 domain-containing protein [Alkalicoccus urumqiensis]|uniref:DUF2905 domain-containing protein n=1 Tax=Alkalicoccus urumqiensis TaxID=1548213 RepID=A0A2P6MFH0_ALKUR|nr:DUF2905 domain-containing protein [Alkalicoccus urumqiensis]PRO65003.1 DUF2905 domain-containing protein [Alkalicoccus urumqiensis]
MDTGPKLLLLIGVICIAAALIWMLFGRFLPIGRLPGDFLFQRGSTTFYFPLMTSIIISIVLSLLFMLFRR